MNQSKENKNNFLQRALSVSAACMLLALNATAQPVISSISSATGIPGNTLTISGTGFNASPTLNEVTFGAAKATITGGSSTHLNVTIPAGATYGPVRVLNQVTHLSAASSAFFLPSFSNAGHVPGSINFNKHINLPVEYAPFQVLIHDVDGDDKNDIITVDYEGGAILIYRNTSVSGVIDGSSFAAPEYFLTMPSTATRGVILRDVDGDGKPDIVAVQRGLYHEQTVVVYRNVSIPGIINSGSFEAPRVVFSRRGMLMDICIDDFDRDGKPDIAGAFAPEMLIDSTWYMSWQGMVVVPNTSIPGSVSFGTSIDTDIPTGSPMTIASGDLDQDGKIDLVVADYYSGSNFVIVFQNFSATGVLDASSFSYQATYHVGETPSRPVLVDWDGDGKPEITTISPTPDNYVSILPNYTAPGTIGPFSFGAPIMKEISQSPYKISIGDFDGDGKPDFAAGDGSSTNMSVVRNTFVSGPLDWSAFSYVTNFAVTDDMYAGSGSSAVGDLDGDGRPDIAVTCSNQGYVAILRNNPLDTISGLRNICVGSATGLAHPKAGGTWSSGTPGIATISPAGNVTGIAPGTAAITYTLPATEGGMVTTTVTVSAYPAAISGPAHLCPAGSITLTNASAGGTWSSAHPGIATIGSSSGIVTGVAPGTATISYMNSANCTVTRTVNVMTAPGTISGNVMPCQTSTGAFTNPVAGGTWSASSTSIISFPSSASGSYSTLNTGTATITYTTCGIATTVATVTPALKGVFASPATVCAGSTTTLSAVANNTYFNTVASIPYAPYAVGGPGILASDDGSVSVAMPFLFRLYGTFYSTVHINANGFVSFGSATSAYNYTAVALPSANAPVAATPQPIIALFWHDMNSSSVGTIATATFGSSPNRVFVINYNGVKDYSGSTTNTGQIILHENSGIIDMMIGSTGGGVTYNKTCGVQNAAGTLGVAAPGQNAAPYTCVNTGWRFYGSPSGAATYSWSPAGTLSSHTAATPVATPTVAGSATYSVTVSSPGCTVYGSTTVSVNPTPSAISGSAAVCVGANVTLTATPAGGQWTSGTPAKGTIGLATGVATGIAAGTTNITYTNTATGCFSTRLQTVNPLPNAGTITASSPSVVVGGTMTVTTTATGGVWFSSNGSQATVNAAGVVTGVAPGSPQIKYSVTNSCGTNISSKQISVLAPRPAAETACYTDASFRIFPNPSAGYFSVEAQVAGAFAVYTIDGKEIARTNVAAGTTGISLPAGLAAGVYMCRFDGADGSSVNTRLIYQP